MVINSRVLISSNKLKCPQAKSRPGNTGKFGQYGEAAHVVPGTVLRTGDTKGKKPFPGGAYILMGMKESLHVKGLRPILEKTYPLILIWSEKQIQVVQVGF